MHVAVTGSTGLIGSALVDALTQRGDRVTRVVRRAPSANEIQWDIAAGTIDTAGLSGVDAVVHLAAEALANKKWTLTQKKMIENSRIRSTTVLSGALAGLDSGPSILLNGAAVGVYGDRGDEILTEESDVGDNYLARLCIDWEASTRQAEDAGIRVAQLRTGLVLSTKGGALAEQLPFFKVGLGGRIGAGRQFWSWISIDDQVGAIIHVLDNEISGPVNLTGPAPVPNADFVNAIGAAVGRPTLLPTPTVALNLRLGKEAVREMLFASQRAVPQVLLDSGYDFQHPTIDAAAEAVLASDSS